MIAAIKSKFQSYCDIAYTEHYLTISVYWVDLCTTTWPRQQRVDYCVVKWTSRTIHVPWSAVDRLW